LLFFFSPPWLLMPAKFSVGLAFPVFFECRDEVGFQPACQALAAALFLLIFLPAPLISFLCAG